MDSCEDLGWLFVRKGQDVIYEIDLYNLNFKIYHVFFVYDWFQFYLRVFLIFCDCFFICHFP